MHSYAEIWEHVLEGLAATMTQTQIDLWFREMEIIALNDTDAHLVIKSDFKRDIIEKRYAATVTDQLSQVLGFEVYVHFHSNEKGSVDMTLIEDSLNPAKANPVPAAPPADAPAQQNAPDILTAADSGESTLTDVRNTINYSPGYTFDNFIVGKSNLLAREVALAVANNPASAYNPVFLYGASGLGKTHLLHAIINHVAATRPDTKIIYTKGEEFTNKMIESIRRETTQKFRDTYRTADILLIDDIQFIAGKEGTQEEFFHTFNALYEDEKQIIMTSDRPPRDIKTLEERLKTRFEWGLTADVQPPDFELRVAIMKNKAESKNLDIPDDVLMFLAENLRSNVRQMEGAIQKLGAHSFLTGSPINVDLAVTCIADLITGSEPISVTVDRIVEKVSRKYGISVEDIKSRKRTKDIASARHIAIYLIRKMTDMSLPAIGKYMGRDHSTIMSSLDTIENEIARNAIFDVEINELIKSIKES